MPSLINSGPIIPDKLLQLHEEGEVIFFCGAGISYPASLPGFKGLVDNLYQELGTQREPDEQTAYDTKQYDRVIHLLEKRITGKRERLREKLCDILKPDTSKEGALATHNAILDLALDRAGSSRLVTTNFDQLFRFALKARERDNLDITGAPYLPIPQKGKWNSLVHLHGELPDQFNTASTNRLVVSSGDFGLAYLVERWAARFVTELFKNFTVCFLGYSLDDPVLRYVVDALAADEMQGGRSYTTYAFAAHDGSNNDAIKREWRAKGVTPILYSDEKNHLAFHKTLSEWAKIYRNGATGKKMIIAADATKLPADNELNKESTDRVLWALSDPIAAKHFAELQPAPPLAWLDKLSEDRYNGEDYTSFETSNNGAKKPEVRFSFLNRPTRDLSVPKPYLVRSGENEAFNQSLFHIANWLTRHLNNPHLIHWIVKNGGHLHSRFEWVIQRALDKIAEQEQKGETLELEQKAKGSPDAIPSPEMRTLWRIILTKRLDSNRNFLGLYGWWDLYKRDGLTPSVRASLRSALAAKAQIHEPYRFKSRQQDKTKEAVSISDIARCEIVLNCDHPHSFLDEKKFSEFKKEDLAKLLSDSSFLLKEAFDLMAELCLINNKGDHTHIHQPSISPHSQNKDYDSWTILIDLTRETWLAATETDPASARRAAEEWIATDYPLFKRLAYFAATHNTVIDTTRAVSWLLIDGAWWIWSTNTQREVMRLLVSIAHKLKQEHWDKLEPAILDGPPKEMFRQDLEDEEFSNLSDRSIWLILAKLGHGGANLPQQLSAKFEELNENYPEWEIDENEQDEFPFWMGEANFIDPDRGKIDKAPRNLNELKQWLIENPHTDQWEPKDDWRLVCNEEYETALKALQENGEKGEWQTNRLLIFLQRSAEQDTISKSWPRTSELLTLAPDEVLAEELHAASYWLERVRPQVASDDQMYLQLINRVITIAKPLEDTDESDNPVSRAINHPVGHCADGAIRWYYSRKPKFGHGIAKDIKDLFTLLCDEGIPAFRHGRVLLSAHVINLFRLDEDWTKEHLLPYFSWGKSLKEAKAAWEGFLWSPELYREFILQTKTEHLDTLSHIEELGDHARHYIRYLTFACLDSNPIFDSTELAAHLNNLSTDDLCNVARSLANAIDGIEGNKVDYWNDSILPFVKSAWPKSNSIVSSALSESIAEIHLKSGDAFPLVFSEFKHWITPINYPAVCIMRFYEQGLCRPYPREALHLLNKLVGEEIDHLPEELFKCLTEINEGNASMKTTPEYRRLLELCQKWGYGLQ